MSATSNASERASYGPVLDIVEFWCGDCRQVSAFEQIKSSDTSVADREWACTRCGAAYIDTDDQAAIAVAPAVRGVA